MKTKTIFCFLIALFFVTNVIAQERGLAVVSPGSDVGVAIVGESCPTFSWTGVEWATAYTVAVFEAVSAEALSYEEMRAMASPVLSKEIKGRALSWTPSSDERLSNGGMYVWYVRAEDAYGKVMWSEGKVFKVEVEARLVGMEETVRESLKEHGVSDETIEDVLRDMEYGVKEVVVWGVDTEGNRGKTQDKVGIQGTEGTTNTFYGLGAGSSIATGGDYNSFFGRSAGNSTTTGDSNTFIGNSAGYSNTLGHCNSFIGYHAGYKNTGNNNCFIGYLAGYNNTTSIFNCLIGYRTGYNNTTGSFNTFIGNEVGENNTTGQYNTFIGYQSGYFNTTGQYNTCIGYGAGYSNTTASGYTFIGYQAGSSNTIGGNNTFIGHNAGRSNTTGQYHTCIGYGAGENNTTASGHTFIGYQAGSSNTTGGNNTFIGHNAGRSNTTGFQNTFLGRSTGYSNTSGHNNVFLGYLAGSNEAGSNRLYIDSLGASFPLIYGEFDNGLVGINGKLGVGTKSPGYPMHLQKTGANAAFIADRTDGAMNYINATAGYGNFGTVNNYPLRMVVNAVWKMRLDSDNSLTMANGASCTSGGVWTDASSRELKENIHSLTTAEAMDALRSLNPVKYNYKSDKEENCVGFIAEEVPDLVASKDRKGMSPMDVVAVLTKVVQEQQKLTEKQQKTIDELRKAIDEMKKKNN